MAVYLGMVQNKYLTHSGVWKVDRTTGKVIFVIFSRVFGKN
jgi:hypothetical protein